MIHLALTFDNNFLRQFYALLCSVFSNNKDNNFTFHVIATGLTLEEKGEIEKYIKANYSFIFFYEIDENLANRFVLTNSNYSSATYYRLFFSYLLDNSISKLLYIDTDTLVVNNLKELYATDLGKYPVGAVYDIYVKKNPTIGIEVEGKYFNAGVLLINLDEWRKQEISEKTIEFLLKYPEKILYVDQDALNFVLINNWYPLDFKYNLMYSYIPKDTSMKDLNIFIKDKVIIHFTLQRPWFLVCRNRFRFLYAFYLKQSPSLNKKVLKPFSFNDFIVYLSMRFMEFYFDMPLVGKVWRMIKR